MKTSTLNRILLATWGLSLAIVGWSTGQLWAAAIGNCLLVAAAV